MPDWPGGRAARPATAHAGGSGSESSPRYEEVWEATTRPSEEPWEQRSPGLSREPGNNAPWVPLNSEPLNSDPPWTLKKARTRDTAVVATPLQYGEAKIHSVQLDVLDHPSFAHLWKPLRQVMAHAF